jgi:hypothetical protein
MRIVLIVLSLLSGSILFSQDSTWQKVRVNEDLVLSLPGKITKQEKVTKEGVAGGKIFVYTAKGKYSILGVTITPNKANLNINEKHTHKKALKEIEEGARKGGTGMGYICKTYPTIVDSIEGIKLLMYKSDTASDPYIQQNIFIVNDRMYSFVQAPKSEDVPVSTDEMDILLKSVRFNHSVIKEQKFDSKTESVGYKFGYTIGQFLGYLLVAGAIWLIVKLILSKSKKKQDGKDKYNY